MALDPLAAAFIAVEDNAELLRGAPGDPGPAGVAGPSGPMGADGPPGATGPEGVIGPPGPEGQIGPDGPAGPRGDPGRAGRDGQRGLLWRGAWQATQDYGPPDAVEYRGSSYVATGPSQGQPPPGGAWDLLAQKGEPGPQGLRGTSGGGGGGSSPSMTGPFALSVRVLTADATIPADMSAVVVGPLNLNGFTVTLGSNAALAVI